MTTKIESLTEEQWQKVFDVRDKWLGVGRSTTPHNREESAKAIVWAYAQCNMPAPEVIWVDGPEALIDLAVERTGNKDRQHHLNGFCGGVLWWPWLAHYCDAIQCCGIEPCVPTDELRHYLEHAPLMLPMEGLCIVCDRPEVLKVDEQGRLHGEDGPAWRWKDGTEVYAFHGTRVPKEWILDKPPIEAALTWENIEQRRAAAEILGWAKVLEQLNPTIVDRHPDPEIGTLLRCDLPDSPGEQFLKVRCATGRDFCIPVPGDIKTAIEAQEKMWQLEPGEYDPEVAS